MSSSLTAIPVEATGMDKDTDFAEGYVSEENDSGGADQIPVEDLKMRFPKVAPSLIRRFSRSSWPGRTAYLLQ
jgi:hypothetical protein